MRVAQATQQCHNEHNLQVILVHESEMEHYVDDVHEVFAHLVPAHKADFFRVNVLGE